LQPFYQDHRNINWEQKSFPESPSYGASNRSPVVVLIETLAPSISSTRLILAFASIID